jgi:hypothetical protein
MNLYLARCYFRLGKIYFSLADYVGEYWLLEWSQRYLDGIGDWCMGESTKCLMEYYWNINPDAEQDE